MKQTIIFLTLLILVLSLIGCAAEATPAPTSVNPAEIGMTMLAQKVDAEATQLRVGLQFTATAQVIEATRNVESTQAAMAVTEQFRQDAVATDAQVRRDAAATEQRKRDEAATEQARRDVEATAEQDRLNVIGTATAQMAATWSAATLQVLPMHDQWTQQAVAMEQALATNEVELSNLDVQQQTQKNTLEWAIPFLISIAMTALLSMYVIRRSRTREIKNDETGAVDALLIDNEQVIRPQLMPGPVLDISGKIATAPQVTDAETQNEVTRRAQAVEALRAMPTQAPTANATLMANQVFGETRKPLSIEVVEPDQVRPWLDDVMRQADEEES